MVRHTTSAGASIRTSRSITRPDISIRSLLWISATDGSRSGNLLQPSVAYVLIHRNVLTMDPNRPRATAVAVAHGLITALDEVPPGAARVADLRGATVLPGFHDAHNHMIGFGMSLGEVDIGSPPVGSLDELYAAIARRAETTEPGEW